MSLRHTFNRCQNLESPVLSTLLYVRLASLVYINWVGPDHI
jgi:hypothetical protein